MRSTLRAIGLLTCVWLSYNLGVVLEARRHRSLFEGVREVVGQYYVEPIDSDSLALAGANGVLRYLGDPHSGVLDPRDFAAFRENTRGEYGGIGTQIEVRSNQLTVVAPLPGEAAERAGVRAGDEVIAVDSRSTRGWSAQDAVHVLRGEAGSDVVLTVRRGSDTLEIPVRREHVRINAVGVSGMIADQIGYVALDAFSMRAADEIAEAIDSLVEDGARAIVLDLRGNPGGLLDQGIAVANLFLPKGTLIAETRGRSAESTESFHAREDARYPNLPLAVVVNGTTASAAEIVAGALSDHGRAHVYGERTYGKGSVQTLFPLPTGHVIKLTTARWYTPAGRSLEGGANEQGGIEPDRLVADSLALAAEAALQSSDAEWGALFEQIYRAAANVVAGAAQVRTEAHRIAADLQTDDGRFVRWLEREIELEVELRRNGVRLARLKEAAQDPAVQAAVRSLLP